MFEDLVFLSILSYLPIYLLIDLTVIWHIPNLFMDHMCILCMLDKKATHRILSKIFYYKPSYVCYPWKLTEFVFALARVLHGHVWSDVPILHYFYYQHLFILITVNLYVLLIQDYIVLLIYFYDVFYYKCYVFITFADNYKTWQLYYLYDY